MKINLLLVLFLFFSKAFTQNVNVKHLEEIIYMYNNNKQYKESINLINKYLSDQKTTNDDKFYLYLFYSFTHKRLFDYKEAEIYLYKALQAGMKTTKQDFYKTNIDCQLSYIHFDVQQYQKADSLMKEIESNEYAFIDYENKSKLMMQRAYLFYLNKHYEKADQLYNKTYALMSQHAFCDLPILFTKQMALYQAMNLPKKVRDVYSKSLNLSDSCHIEKYRSLTLNTMKNIILPNNELGRLIIEIDSLNSVYDQATHLKNIKALENNYEISLKDLELKNQKNWSLFLSIFVFTLFFALAALAFFFHQNFKQKKIIEKQYAFNDNLISILSHDIKEPLVGLNYLLKKIENKDQYISQASQSLKNQILSVNQLLNDVLEIKKTEHRLNLVKEINLYALCNEAITLLNYKWSLKNIAIQNRLPQNLFYKIEPNKMKHVVKTILDNAIKYSEINSTINIETTPNGIVITDNGIGIEESKLSTLTKTIQLAQVGTQGEIGNGMGLLLLQSILSELKINLEYKSTLKQGTQVYINFK